VVVFPIYTKLFTLSNGTGKSTLLEAIAVSYGFNPEGGSKNFAFSTNDSHSKLYSYTRLVKGIKLAKDGFFLRAESFYNVATEVDRLDPSLISAYGGISLHSQSHGESFMSLMMNRLFGNGLYIFDEPEAALSPVRQMAMLRRIHDLVKNNSQFIIATHSPILMAYPHATILEVSSEGIKETQYEETENYIFTKYFLNNREKMLNDILSEEE
jgi:predicted ATPase